MTYANTDTARAAEWMADHQYTYWKKWAVAVWRETNDGRAVHFSVSESARCRLGNLMLAQGLPCATIGVSVSHVIWTQLADVWLADIPAGSEYQPMAMEMEVAS